MDYFSFIFGFISGFMVCWIAFMVIDLIGIWRGEKG